MSPGLAMARASKRSEPIEAGTRHIRVYADIAEMISEILLVREDLSSAALLDPMVRAGVTAMHAQLKPQLDRVRKVREELKRTLAQARNEVAEEGPHKPRKAGPG